jgi:hypothetical protein
MNDDDIYIVHPDKKHIAARIPASTAGYVDRYSPHSNKIVKSYLDRANQKHGNGHVAQKGMSIRNKNFKALKENTMDDLSKHAPFSADLSSFRPAQIEEDYHDDGTKKSTGNAFDLSALKKKKDDDGANLRNHDKIKTSTGAVYKRKENAVGADTTDVKQPEKRGRGRPPGKYGSYKKRIKEALEAYSVDLDEEQLDELSKETLVKYASANRKDAEKRSPDHKQAAEKYLSDPDFYKKKGSPFSAKEVLTRYNEIKKKRDAGFNKAMARLTKEDLDEMSAEELDALIEGIDQDKDRYHKLIHTGELDFKKKKQKTSSAKSLSDIHKEVKTLRTDSEPRNNTYKLHHSVSSTKPIAILKKSGWEHHSGSHKMFGYNSKVTYKHPDGHTITYHHDTHTLSIKQAEQRAPSEKSLTKEDLDEMSAEEFDALIENFEQLDELSRKTLAMYTAKAASDARNRTSSAKDLESESKYYRNNAAGSGVDAHMKKVAQDLKNSADREENKAQKRMSGVFKAASRLATNSKVTKEDIEDFMQTEEYESLDELSKATLGSYVKKASTNAASATRAAGVEAGARGPNRWANMNAKENRAEKRLKGVSKAVSRLTKEGVESRDIENSATLTNKIKKKLSLKDPNQNTKAFAVGESVEVETSTGVRAGKVSSITESLLGVVHTGEDKVNFYNPQYVSKVVMVDADPTLLEGVSWERWGTKVAPKESVGQWIVTKHQTGYRYGHQENVDHIIVEGTGLDAATKGQEWAKEQGLEQVFVAETFTEKKDERLTLNEIFSSALRV